MYTIYVLTAICIAWGVRLYLKGTKRDLGEFLFHTGCGAVIGLVVSFLLAMLCSKLVPTQEVTGKQVTLVSMRNESGMSGSFIFGTGSVNTSISYHFLKKQSDGSLAPDSVSSSEVVRFIEDPTLTNTGYWTTTIRRADPLHWLYYWTIFHSDHSRIIRQEFRIPVGSVVQQFKIQ